MATYLAALFLTFAIEVPIYVVGLRVAGGIPWRRAALAGGRVNAASHILGFLVAYPALCGVIGSAPALVLVEIGVVCLEAALLGRQGDVGWEAAWVLSTIANVVSLTIGLLVLR